MKHDAPIEISRPRTAAELSAYYELRWRVLRAPWQQPPGSERDEFEQSAEHVLARDADGEIVGVGRLHFVGNDARIRYMAVAEPYRGRGIGSAVLCELERLAMERGARSIRLNARLGAARGFYEAHAYIVIGAGPTLFGDVHHVEMQKQLSVAA